MALNQTDSCSVVDQSIPQWKRELLLRRRVLGRTLQAGGSSVKLTCPAVVAAVRQPDLFSGSVSESTTYYNKQKCSPTVEEPTTSSLNQNRVDFHPGTSSAGSFSNMRLLDACGDVNNILLNGLDVKNKQSDVVTNSDSCVNYNLIMGEDKTLNLKKKSISGRTKLDQNNTTHNSINRQNYFLEKVSNETTNGNSKKDEDCLSDSSEELQYGPGIVNKLKTKYLSMTLREQKRNSRPSISSLRRATSLENMLEDGNVNKQSKIVVEPKIKTENIDVYDKTSHAGKLTGPTSHHLLRHLGSYSRETMKRARSMDTLLKSETRATIKPIVNENIVIVEKETLESNPSQDTSAHLRNEVNTELPPPDLVKQTLKIFETSPTKKLKTPKQNNLAKLVAGFSNSASQPVTSVSGRSIDRRKNGQNKPSISPKPVLSPEKLKRSRINSPKKIPPSNNTVHVNRIESQTSTNIEKPKHQLGQNDRSVTDRKPRPASPKLISPRSISPVVTVLTNSEQPSIVSGLVPKNHSQNTEIHGENESVLVPFEEFDDTDNNEMKSVPESALENIRRGGLSMQFSFSSEKSNSSSIKSYLPRPKSPTQALNTSLLKDKADKSPPTHIVSSRPQGSPQIKQVGIIRPLVSTKIQSRPSSIPPLTEQEIEKNLINRVKSIEQPISKVVVAIKGLPENVVLGSVSSEIVTNKTLTLPHVCANSKVKSQGLWDEKVWQQNQNTIVFNFSNRKEVPDYIENDGLILRGKRDRPRPGEGGFILLDNAGDESSTDGDEDQLTSAPPSPCDVTFEGDNVLINGKSNLQKNPKQVKLRIKFNDEATTMFEYPSEASLVEEEYSELIISNKGSGERETSNNEASTSHSPSSSGLSMSLGGTLGAYTPRQVSAEEWQLGMTPVASPQAPSPTTSTINQSEDVVDHLKPAPPEATVAWSEDTASDLLF